MQPVVWLVASSFEPRSSTLYTLRLAGRLPEFGFRPRLICTSARQIPQRLKSALDVVEAPYLHHRLWRSWSLKRFLERVGGDPPDLIHAQRRVHAPASLEIAAAFDRPCVETVHDAVHSDARLPDVSHLKAVIAVNRTAGGDLAVKLGVPNELVHFTTTGVDAPPDAPRPQPANGAPRLPVVGMASVLEPSKGAMYFLMAADLILSSGQDVEFLIAGGGVDESTLRRAARRLDVAHRVTFVGHAFDYRELLSAMDLFASPSQEHGLAVIVLEAMAMGLPVVATDVGGIGDLFRDNEHLFLVPPADHVALAEKIQTLLDNPGKARQVAEAGKEFIRREFSVERMLRDVVAIYQKVLADWRSPAAVRTAIQQSPGRS